MSRSYFLLLLIAAVGILLTSGEVLSSDKKTKAAAVAPFAPSHGVSSDIVAAKRSLRVEATTDDDIKDLNLLIFDDSKATSYNFNSSLASDEERAIDLKSISAKISAATQKFQKNPQVLKITAQVKSATDKLKANPQFIRLSQDIKAVTNKIKANPNVVEFTTQLKILQGKAMQHSAVKKVLNYMKDLRKATTAKQ
ncbi:hypothetical protein PHYBOEH_004067 [Phytophthora boehmeriae]|uniref:RxLR effector protein n=1 Tax=Phytophthora boehmeriae TaxID=109152 RepID=A0A8T1X508_9STRA|nr:hypothetical protein PHYBOEH_004067 [Phytophthora boehmeriae]